MDIIKKIENSIANELIKDKKDRIDEIFLFSLKELLISSKETIDSNNQRILRSKTIENKEFNIYTTLINKDEILFYEKMLFPVLDEDVINSSYYNTDKNEMYLGRVFINVPYSEISDFVSQIYNGNVKINDKHYNVKFKISLVNKYFEKTYEIYNLFMKNKISWKTINIPYMYKFFDVSVEEYPENMPVEGEVEEYNIELDEYKIEKNIILVWNLKKYLLNSELFIRPIIERINYEYKINISGEKKILLESYEKEISYIYKDEEDIVFVLDEKIDEILTVYEFMESEHFMEKSEYPYGIYNNKNSYALKIEKSKEEIITFLNKINIFKDIFTIEDLSLSISGYEIVNNYGFNGFIKSEFEIKDRRKKIFLVLNKIKESIFWEDSVSYLISEINLKIKELEFLPVIRINEGQ